MSETGTQTTSRVQFIDTVWTSRQSRTRRAAARAARWGGDAVASVPAACAGRRWKTVTPPHGAFPDVIHRIEQREMFDALFQQGASVTAGAPSELKFLIDRAAAEIYFLPPKYPFHFEFYRAVLNGPLSNAA